MIAVSTGSLASYSFSGGGIRPHYFIPRFIETSGEINDFMKIHVVNLAEKSLRQASKWIAGARVAVMGHAARRTSMTPESRPLSRSLKNLLISGSVRYFDRERRGGALGVRLCGLSGGP